MLIQGNSLDKRVRQLVKNQRRAKEEARSVLMR